MGRIAFEQKNLDTVLDAFRRLAARRAGVHFNFHGGGQDLARFRGLIASAGLETLVTLHGPYDHRRDLPAIVSANHLFVYTSRYEGGPCFTLIELLQAGRFTVTSPVGGIPDIYAGRPEIGDLVPPDAPIVIADALDCALMRIEGGAIDPIRIRAVYEAEFREEVAHRQWLAALRLKPIEQGVDPDAPVVVQQLSAMA
jgi:glycosyltransferase involved in cell wall biosynthesis